MNKPNKEVTQGKGFKTKGRLYDKSSKKAAHTMRKLRQAGRGFVGHSINASLEG